MTEKKTHIILLQRTISFVLVVTVIGSIFAIYRRLTHTPEGRARHVIFISLDTTRADHLGCYGNTWINTPNIDKLAEESILFTNCITAAPTTLASHTSLFTGNYPHTHGTPRNGFEVNDKNKMLAEILKEAGFHTAGFIGSFVLSNRFNFAQGFDYFDENLEPFIGLRNKRRDQRSAESVTDSVINYLDNNGVPPNLFLFVHYFDPHRPYAAPVPYNRMYDRDNRASYDEIELAIKQKTQQLDKDNAFTRSAAARYAGEITYMDAHVGRLVEYLKRRGVLKHAVLVLTSDHGENFWRHQPYFNHGHTTYQSCLQCVCIIRLPDADQSETKVAQLIGNIDLYPSVLSYLGLPVPSGIDGEAIDLRNCDKAFTPRTRFSEATKPHRRVETDPRWVNIRKSRCICEGTYKYIQTPYMKTEELYNYIKDPDETDNLLAKPTGKSAARAVQLRKKLEDWATSSTPLPARFIPKSNDDAMKRLRSLGYVR